MSASLERLERIARAAASDQAGYLAAVEAETEAELHPFETRNIHPDLPRRVRRLFDDGHWEQSVFEAFKYVEVEVKRISGIRRKTGFGLMMEAFNESDPRIRLNPLATDSDVDEQRGFRSMFAGAAAGIRNPRGHEVELGDSPDEALDYLALASILLRRLDSAGLR